MRILNLKSKLSASACLACIFPMLSFAQPNNVNNNFLFNTTVSGYDALSINPANIALNRKTDFQKNVSLGFMQGEGQLNSQVVKRNTFHKKKYLSEEQRNDNHILNRLFNKTGFWMSDVLQRPTNLTYDLTWFGLGFHTKGAGSFAMSVRTRSWTDVDINGFNNFESSNIVGYKGYMNYILNNIETNIAQNNPASGDYDDSYVKTKTWHEFNLGYSRAIVSTDKVALLGGLGIKYIAGVKNMGLLFNENELSGYTTSTIFAGHELSTEGAGGGKGWGGSIGASFIMDKKLRVSAAVNDIGSIQWGTQTVDWQDDNTDALQELKESGFYDEKDLLPTRLVFGAGYNVHKNIAFFTDILAPLNDADHNLKKTIGAVGTELSLSHYVSLKTGLATTESGVIAVPTYLSFFAGQEAGYEFTIGSADLLSFFKDKRNYVQGNLAMFKFYF